MLGAVAYTALATRLPPRATFAVCFLLAGSPRLFTLAATDDLVQVLAISFGAGVAMAAVNPIMMAVGYERVPEHLRARGLGAIGALGFAGILLGGALADAVGSDRALLAGAVLYLAVTLTPFVLPQWRRLDRPMTDRRQEASALPIR